MADPRVLVTGATGFIGRNLVRHLTSRGMPVAALSRSRERAHPIADLSTVQVLPFTSALDASARISEARPEVVVHLATRFVARHGDARDAIEMLQANVEFGAGVLEACRATGASLVSASTVWQHFESRPYAPVSVYAATKQAFDDLAEYYALFEGLRWTRLVLGDTYGPGDDRGKLLTALLTAAATGEPLPMSTGTQLWDPVHVADVVAALEGIIRTPAEERGRQWQLTSDDVAPIRTYVDRVAGAIGRPVPVTWGARPERGREMTTPWIVADRPPGWRPLMEFARSVSGIWQAEFGTDGAPAASPQ